jgi:hypothetical protein
MKGQLQMQFRDRHVWIGEGEFLIVPKGVEHRPVAPGSRSSACRTVAGIPERSTSTNRCRSQESENACHKPQCQEHQIYPQGFRIERSRLVSSLEDLVEDMVSHTALHPRLQQSISLLDLCFFVAVHDDQHLARISEPARLQQYRMIAESFNSH